MKRIVTIALLISWLSADSQVSDNFTDGDFIANPVWTGEIANWTITTNQLNNNGPAVTPTITYLSTPSWISSNATWEFWANPKCATSSGNYFEIYLMSDSANIKGNNSGYFVRIGDTPDDVSLYVKKTGIATKIIDGTDALIISSTNNPTKVRVTRNNLGLWSLEADNTGTGASYLSQGTVTDTTYFTSNYFGVLVKYSSANNTKYFFDDLLITDVTAPKIRQIDVIFSTQLDVYFDEKVEQTSSETITNYSVDNGIGNPVTASRDANNFNLIHLTFSTPFADGILNTLTINNVQDFGGNAIVSETGVFKYIAPVVPAFRDILINEIFADPSPQIALPAFEFVELYNNSAKTFDLNGWKFSDPSSTATLSSLTFAPGEYLILCNKADTSLFKPYGKTMGVSSFPSLNNAGDNIYLKDNSGAFIDSVNYDISWYRDAVKDDGGWTLELINPNVNMNCPIANNWIASTNSSGGTPGIQNSVFNPAIDNISPTISSVTVVDSMKITVCFSEPIDASQINILANYSVNNGLGNPISAISNSNITCVDLAFATNFGNGILNTITFSNLSDCSGNPLSTISSTFTYSFPIYKDVIINEIFADPSPIVGLPSAEFIEIYNKSSKTFDISNWKLSDASGTGTIGIKSLVPNEYIILCNYADTSFYSSFGKVIGVTSFPSWNNAIDKIFLQDNTGRIIDSLTYYDTWYKDAAKQDGGWTLELINPNTNLSCYPSANWIASNDVSGGTPGKQNSVYSTSPDVTNPLINTVTVIDTLHVQVCFSEPIDIGLIGINTNYLIDNSIGNPLTVNASSDYLCIDLTLSANLQSGIIYTLSVSSLSDCWGNLVSPNSQTFSYFKTEDAAYHDVIINEIFPDPDPSVSLPNKEFVEIYNRSNKNIDLSGWKFSDATSTATLKQYLLLPNTYLILCSTTDTTLFKSYGNVMGVGSLPSLNNASDTILLNDNNGKLIDKLVYSDTWYNDVNKDDGGWTLERKDVNYDCVNPSNWAASTDISGGTPGKVNSVAGAFTDNISPELISVNILSDTQLKINFSELMDSSSISLSANYLIDNGIGNPSSVNLSNDFYSATILLSSALQHKIIYRLTIFGATDCPGNSIGIKNTIQFALADSFSVNDVIINEVLYEPKENGVEYVEIYNRSTNFINLKTLRISTMDNVSGALTEIKNISIEDYLFYPNQYLLLSKDASIVKSQYYTPSPDAFLNLASMPGLNNDGDIIVLSKWNDEVIDKFTYTPEMQFALLNSTAGVSLERINFERVTEDKTNWHSAAETVGFGTPGYKNSQYNDEGGTGEISLSPEAFSPDNDGINDVLNIKYQFDKSYVANVSIFDSKGRLTKSLFKNELLGTFGTLSWDGTTDSREKARVGIYIIWFEAFDAQGTTKHFKKACVVATRF